MLDPRLTPARPDLAAAHLRGVVEAPRYAAGRAMRVVEASAPLRRAPRPDAPLDTEALYGDTAVVYDEAEGWAWAQLAFDKYVGYLPAAALGAQTVPPTHRVAALRTHAYPGPSIKLPPRFALSLGAQVAIVGEDRPFAVSSDGLFFWAGHLAEIASREPDFVAVAERFLETPYLWGGRTSEGIDCSGLIQTALTASGIPCPRDSDMIEAALGRLIAPDGALIRGDLVFWRGHVGVMRDGATLLHANGSHMKVASEPLAEARARIVATGGGGITSVRRL